MFSSFLTKLRNLSLLKKLILIAIVAILIWYFGFRSTSDEKATYEWGTAQTGDITQLVSESGQILDTNTQILSTIEGIVDQVYVSNGDQVQAGAKLYSVNSTATAAERSSAYASYLSAKNSLDAAQSKLYSLQSSAFNVNQKFINDAVERELSSDDPTYIQQYADWKAAEEAYIQQDTAIKQARAALSNAWLNYQAKSSGTVTATTGGTIANISIASGQQVDTDTSSLIILSPAQPIVQITVTENDVTKIAPDQPATITIEALNGIEVPAHVDRVDSVGTDNSGVITYNVYLTLDSQDQLLASGMTADVDIITQQASNILTVPNAAIKPYQGEKAVQIKDPVTSEIIYQPVTVGISDTTHTQILTGLEEGQEILLSSSSDSEQSGGGGLFGGGPRG